MKPTENSASVNEGRTTPAGSATPATGSKRRSTAKRMISSRPVQNTGIETPNTANDEIRTSKTVLWRGGGGRPPPPPPAAGDGGGVDPAAAWGGGGGGGVLWPRVPAPAAAAGSE